MDPIISDIDAQIEWPSTIGDWLPDVTFAWIEEGLTDLSDFQDVDGLNVTLDTDVELVITGGADAERFEISQDGLTLKALQAFDIDSLDDDLLPGVLSVELALRDAEDNLFDQTRAYILVRPEDTLGSPYADVVETVWEEVEPYWLDFRSGDLELSDLADLLDGLSGSLDSVDWNFLALRLLNELGQLLGGTSDVGQSSAAPLVETGSAPLFDLDGGPGGIGDSDIAAIFLENVRSRLELLQVENPELYAELQALWRSVESWITDLRAGDADLSDLVDQFRDFEPANDWSDLFGESGVVDQLRTIWIEAELTEGFGVLLSDVSDTLGSVDWDFALMRLLNEINQLLGGTSTSAVLEGAGAPLIDPGTLLTGASLEDIDLQDLLGSVVQNAVLTDALEALNTLQRDGFGEQDPDGASNDALMSPADGGDLPTGLGCDLFIGQSDNDRVVYDGVRDDFVHDELGPGVVAIHKPGGDSDLLIGVEEVAFNDGSLVFNIPSDCVEFVYRMYEACYDRAPDLGGLLFWTGVVDRLKEEQSLQAAKDFLADQFVAADEFRDRFGEAPGFEDYIDGMYDHVLGRGADSEGKAWWVDGMNKGLGYDDILIAFAESHENVANTLEDVANGLWVV